MEIITPNSDVEVFTSCEPTNIDTAAPPISVFTSCDQVEINVIPIEVSVSTSAIPVEIQQNPIVIQILTNPQGVPGVSGRWAYKNKIIDFALTDANCYTIFQNDGATEIVNITIDLLAVTPGNPWAFRVLNSNGINITVTNGDLYVGNQLVGNSIISGNELVSTLTIEAQAGNIIAVTELEGNWNYEIS